MSAASREPLTVAAVQLNATGDKAANIARAAELVAEAAGRGARVVLLPEKWTGFGSPEILRACAERLDDGDSIAAMRGWAREHGIHLIGGSITERADGADKLFNTCVAVDPHGDVAAVYRKIHLFDVDVGGQRYRESDLEEGGEEIVTVEVDRWIVGLSICYDVRFPELYRILALRGAEVIVVPAAFTAVTGRDHWELLLRARAVENQAFVVAAGDWGEHPGGKRTHGHSMVVDPWGTILAARPDGDGVVVARLDPQRLEEIRATLPALANRRPGAYRWHSPVEA
jgi:deaminated glutathione amidase